MKRIQEIMSEQAAYCQEEDPISSITQELSGAGELTVINAEKIVTGKITQLDYCMATQRVGKTPDEITVREVMRRETTTVNAYDDEARAYILMRHLHLKRLAVVDEENKLKGSINFITLARRIISLKNRMKGFGGYFSAPGIH